MFTEDLDNERTLRWILKNIDHAAYNKHHADVLLEQLYQRPKEDEHDEF
jgi:hypothetical protein